MKPKVLLNPQRRTLENLFSDENRTRLGVAADLVWAKDEPAPDDVIENNRADLFAVITGRWNYGDVDRFPNLQAILETSGGFPAPSDLDYAKCFSRGIRVLSCAPAFGPTVAEMALGMAIGAARRIVWNDGDFRRGDGHWGRVESRGEFSIFSCQVGFMGFGGLGRCLKPLLEPFNCPIQVFDPWMTDAYLLSQGVTPVDMDTLLSTSKLIFVLATPTQTNRGFIDGGMLERIQSDSVFLLMSRSHVVDFDALTELLNKGAFSAAVDVYPEEPLPQDHPIRQAKNTIFSTHRAGSLLEAFRNIGQIVTNDIEALVQGLPPREMQVADPAFIQLRGQR